MTAIEQQAAQTFTANQDQIAALGEQMAQIAQMMAEKESEPEEPEEPETMDAPLPPQATIVFEAGSIVVDAKSPAVTKTVTGRDSAGNRIELTMTPQGGN